MPSRWNSPGPMIHITSKLLVPADTGCELNPNCLTCPLEICVMEWTTSEKNRYTRSKKHGTAIFPKR